MDEFDIFNGVFKNIPYRLHRSWSARLNDGSIEGWTTVAPCSRIDLPFDILVNIANGYERPVTGVPDDCVGLQLIFNIDNSYVP